MNVHPLAHRFARDLSSFDLNHAVEILAQAQLLRLGVVPMGGSLAPVNPRLLRDPSRRSLFDRRSDIATFLMGMEADLSIRKTVEVLRERFGPLPGICRTSVHVEMTRVRRLMHQPAEREEALE